MDNNDEKTKISEFKRRYTVERRDEDAVVAMHIANSHLLEVPVALDHSSKGGHDHGIDGWHYDDKTGELWIYQSKYSHGKKQVLEGLSDLSKKAIPWLESVLIRDESPDIIKNNCLYNLHHCLSTDKMKLKTLKFILLSNFNRAELEDEKSIWEFENSLKKSKLNEFMKKNGSVITFEFQQYNFHQVIAQKSEAYSLKTLVDSKVELIGSGASLTLAYSSLYDLVNLYRARGIQLFNKNVRLFLNSSQRERERLIKPMGETLELICSGVVEPNIFPFYHTGITLIADDVKGSGTDILHLESPNIINGCQSVSIANSYLETLEKKQDDAKIELFKKINLITKIVIGANDEQLKQIAIANNRQQPIEDWQLYSNDPIHIELEDSLKSIGIFYERQKGKFETLITTNEAQRVYNHTNNTYIKLEQLGQVISLVKGELQLGAKPSLIFLSKQKHDKIFTRQVARYPRDIVYLYNIFKASKSALYDYLKLPTHENSQTTEVFKSPLMRNGLIYLSLIHFYQRRTDQELLSFFQNLSKKAHPRIKDNFSPFYRSAVSKARNLYIKETDNLRIKAREKAVRRIIEKIARLQGINLNGGRQPFSDSSLCNELDFKQDES